MPKRPLTHYKHRFVDLFLNVKELLRIKIIYTKK